MQAIGRRAPWLLPLAAALIAAAAGSGFALWLCWGN